MTNEAVNHYRNLLSPFFRGRKIILAAGAPLAESERIAAVLRELGAERCFLIANGRGEGAPAEIDPATGIVIEKPTSGTFSYFRNYLEALRALPLDTRHHLQRFDPDSDAIVLTHSLYAVPEVSGRAVFAPQRQAWVRWEDKTRVDDLFDRAGLLRAPSRVVPASDEAELSAAHQDLDRGQGTVWSGDSRDGINGAASLVRWVRDRQGERDAREFLAARCDRVRVMPFLEGIPCSIHGMVFPGDVIAFRPAEMVVLRHSRSAELFYAGSATYWDPPTADREAMREIARKVGSYLWRHLGYRGVFTVDGVLTESGFLPTELNPRYGAAMGALSQALPELPLWILDLVVRRGENLDYRAALLERAIITASDERRFSTGWCFTGKRIVEEQRLALRLSRGRFTAAETTSPVDAYLTAWPLADGGALSVRLEEGRIAAGSSFAPYVVKALRFADGALGTSFGKLVPAAETTRRIEAEVAARA